MSKRTKLELTWIGKDERPKLEPRILRANPGYLDAAVQLGLTFYTLGRCDEARAEWTSVLGRDPSREDARMYLRMLPTAPPG